MAPRGRKKRGLMRQDAARDAMLDYGFGTRLINETIKEMLELYNEEPNTNPWKLIEEGGYSMLLERLLEKQEEQEQQLALRNEELAVEQQDEPTQEEEEEQERHVEEGRHQTGSSSNPLLALLNVKIESAVEEQKKPTQEEEEKEQGHHVEETRHLIGSSSTSLVGCGAENGAQTCQNDALSVTNETVVDSSPAVFQPGEATTDSVGVTNETVMDSSPQAAFQSKEATADSIGVIREEVMDSSPAVSPPKEAKAVSTGGTKNSHCGWLSSETESESEEDGSEDDDDEMIQLTPEPLCEELGELIAEIRGQRKRKRPSRWDN